MGVLFDWTFEMVDNFASWCWMVVEVDKVEFIANSNFFPIEPGHWWLVKSSNHGLCLSPLFVLWYFRWCLLFRPTIRCKTKPVLERRASWNATFHLSRSMKLIVMWNIGISIKPTLLLLRTLTYFTR